MLAAIIVALYVFITSAITLHLVYYDGYKHGHADGWAYRQRKMSSKNETPSIRLQSIRKRSF